MRSWDPRDGSLRGDDRGPRVRDRYAALRARPAAAVDHGPHFDHAGHMKRGVDCSDCHGGEKERVEGHAGSQTCTECHKDARQGGAPEKRAATFYDADGKHGLWTPSSRSIRK